MNCFFAGLSGLAIASVAGLALAQTPAPADAQDQSQPRKEQLGTITVTGSALPRTDTETPSPVTIISALDIKRSGLTTVADVVRSISADNSGSVPTAFAIGFAAGSSGVALRGLTVNSTLVLIDGRRAANYALADDGQRSFVDLNTIPLDAVERIEVLKDGASSIYGADAIAGVVNIILRHDYQGSQASVELGNSQHGGGFSRHLTASLGGGNLDTDHYNAYLSFEYQGDNRIAVGQRGFPFNTFDLSALGGNNLNGGQPSLNSGSIYGTVTPGTLGTPGDLTTGIPNPGALAQPLRACGPGSTTTVDPAQGTYCSQNFALLGDDQPAQRRAGLFGRFTVKLNDYTEAYLNTSYYENKIMTDSAGSQIQTGTPHNTNSIALPPTLPGGALNPNNPFAGQGDYALINYAFAATIPGSSEYNNHVLRAVGGVRGTFGDWNYDSAIVINHTWLNSSLVGFINYNQLISDITNGTYNFIDPAQNSPATLAALSPTLNKTSTTDMDSIDLKVSRPLLDLPGGSLGLALGTEWRYEAQDDPDLNPDLAAQGLGVAHTIGNRNVSGAYFELDAPLLKSLEVDVSGRFDHYSDFGTNFAPKIGFKWTPIEAVALRGTYSKGFRAPSFSENGSSASEGFTTYTPPADWAATHNNNGYTLPYGLAQFVTANPNIQPEKSRSLTFGGVFQPVQHLSASIDYYAIRKNNVIVQSDPSVALNDYFAGMPLPPGYTIIADNADPNAPTALPRPLVVKAPYINANSLRTDGLDVNLHANYDLWGDSKFISDLNMTKIFSWKMIFPDGSSQQYVGTEGPYILSSGAGTPRYRASWANTVTIRKAEVTATIYYVSGLFMSAPDITPGCFSTNGATNAPVPPNCRMPSFTDVDLNGTYHLTDHVVLSAGISNLFDRKPPFDPINYAGINYNPTYAQAGLIGRFFKVGVNVKF